jgi:2-C-methyl-D-erythritol 4-phosphate cytidylyltransferase/2-C-methyl-D-erythritol 2,4-cyclodiphosphate synthase
MSAPMNRAIAVVVAAGRSTRLGGGVPKQFLELGGEWVAARSIRAMTSCSEIDGAVVVLPAEDIGGPRDAALRRLDGVLAVVPGGRTRMASALAGVEAVSGADVILVHDGVRPFVAPSMVTAVLEAVRRHGAAVPAVAVRDTVKRDDGGGFVDATLDRAPLRLAQTPQGARQDWMLEALHLAVASGREVTDEGEALERAGRRVALVPGDPANVKITTPADWSDAARRVEEHGDDDGLRVGHGYDVHRFGGTRTLVLGGVAFPGEPGLLGHSDADVVLHAAMDALLGAAGLPDIGHHFPPGDPRFEGADSSLLAREVCGHLRASGFRIANLGLTLLAERPRVREHVGAMRDAIAACFLVEPARVGLTATTLEGLGALGRGEGIACHAVALLRRPTRTA